MPDLRAPATAAVAMLLVVLAACSSGLEQEPAAAPTTPAPATTTPEAEPPPTPVVLAISVDGLNPDALAELDESDVPNLSRLISEGASTLNARTSQELTITLPNHTGMLTGRGVEGDRGTSLTFNDDDGRTLDEVHESYVPGMFDVAHDRGVRTALFAEKDKFRFLVRTWDGGHGADDVTGPDDGRDKIDVADIGAAADLTDDVVDAMRGEAPGLVFWHLAGVDAAGHANGWLTPPYLDAVREVDDRIGEVLAALNADPDLAARTTIILTADHGGPRGETTHSDATRAANYRIPFIAWGRGTTAGADLYALDAGRADPGDDRPGYDGEQPIRNLDVADTALGLLGLPEIADVAGAPVVTR